MDWNDSALLASLFNETYPHGQGPPHPVQSNECLAAKDAYLEAGRYEQYDYSGQGEGGGQNQYGQESAQTADSGYDPGSSISRNLLITKQQPLDSPAIPSIPTPVPAPSGADPMEEKAAQLRAKILKNKQSVSRGSMADRIDGAGAQKPSATLEFPGSNESATGLLSNEGQRLPAGMEVTDHKKVETTTGLFHENIRAMAGSNPQLRPQLVVGENFGGDLGDPEEFGHLGARINATEDRSANVYNAKDIRREDAAPTTIAGEPKEATLVREPGRDEKPIKQGSDIGHGLLTAHRRKDHRVDQDTDVNRQRMMVDATPTALQVPDNAAAYSHYFDDLDEWLELTGYHNRDHRGKVLDRERRRRKLQAELNQLDREEEREKGPSSSRAMPPPPLRSTSAGAGASSVVRTPNAVPPVVAGAKRTSTSSEERPAKQQRLEDRQISNWVDGQTNVEPRSPRKPSGTGMSQSSRVVANIMEKPRESVRSATDDPPRPRYSNESRSDPRPNELRNGSGDLFSAKRQHHQDGGRLANTHSRRNHDPFPQRSLSQDRHVKRSESYHHSRRTQSPSTFSQQDSKRHGPRQSATASVQVRFNNGVPSDAATGQRTRSGRTRYFMIKSWNHENVETSMRDGTWATQPHNEQLLGSAFKMARDVILVFSVNKSMAFQGYARMESLPGAAPTPPWVKHLLWPSSPPFYIRWLQTTETRFSKVGHLKNSLNEGQPVLIGRDGQEIEEECGGELCRLIDLEARKQSRQQGEAYPPGW